MTLMTYAPEIVHGTVFNQRVSVATLQRPNPVPSQPVPCGPDSMETKIPSPCLPRLRHSEEGEPHGRGSEGGHQRPRVISPVRPAFPVIRPVPRLPSASSSHSRSSCSHFPLVFAPVRQDFGEQRLPPEFRGCKRRGGRHHQPARRRARPARQRCLRRQHRGESSETLRS